MKHPDAVIIKAFICTSPKRMEIQAKRQLADGTKKTIGSVGLYLHNSPTFAGLGQTLLAICNDGTGMRTYATVKARDDMLAAERNAAAEINEGPFGYVYSDVFFFNSVALHACLLKAFNLVCLSRGQALSL